MKQLILIFTTIFLLSGCQHVERPEKPKNLISKAQMVDILTDAYLSNAARSINNRTIREQGIKLDSFLYKKHKIDSLQFARSNAYYTANLNTYASIFQQVEERLLALKEKADSLDGKTKKGNEQSAKDSIQDAPTLIESMESETAQDSPE